MDVSIIIVNYNTISFLTNAIDSIFEQTEDIEYEIIVVDNNSTDDSKTILTEKYGDKIIYLGLSENIGFGRANNEAAKIARGRNLFLLNPDTILLNNAIKILSDYLDKNAYTGVCGGNLFNSDMQPTTSFVTMLPSLLQSIDDLFCGLITIITFGKNKYFNYSNKDLRVACIIGADIMIRKELFNNLGGFDPDFFMYHEELELCYRINKTGYKIYSIPDAHIQHLEGKSISDDYEKIKRKFHARLLFLYKTQNKINLFIINIIYCLSSFIRFLIFSILQNKDKKILWYEICRLNIIPHLSSEDKKKNRDNRYF